MSAPDEQPAPAESIPGPTYDNPNEDQRGSTGSNDSEPTDDNLDEDPE